MNKSNLRFGCMFEFGVGSPWVVRIEGRVREVALQLDRLSGQRESV
jgi:hypothetical protein